MKKRVWSLLLTLAMLVSMIPVVLVSADTTWAPTYPDVAAPTETIDLKEWTATVTGTTTAKTFVTAVGSDTAYSGNGSMYVDFAAGSYNNTYVDIRNSGTMDANLSNTKTYTVSLYVKGSEITNGALMIGWNAGSNKQAFTSLNATEPEDSAKAADGWRKYTTTLSNMKTNFRISIQCAAELYIDDVFFASTDAPTVNLIKNPGFEEGVSVPDATPEPTATPGAGWAPTYPDVAAPTVTIAPTEWTAKAGGTTSKVQTNTVVTAVGAENAYSGNNSLYVDFSATDYANTYVNIKNSGTGYQSLSGEYTVSMYVKGTDLTGSSLLMGWTVGTNRVNLTAADAKEPEDAEKAAEGWRKYSVTLNTPKTDFTISIQCETKLYIDDVSVVATSAPTVNLIQNPGFEDGVSTPDATPAPTATPVATATPAPTATAVPGWTPSYPDVTAPAETIDLTEWTATPGGSTGSITSKTFVTAVGAETAYSGTNSMYVDFSASSYGNTYVDIRNSGTMDANLSNTKTYTVSLYIKGDNIANGALMMGWDKDNKDNKSPFTELVAEKPEDAAKAAEGWRKYTATLEYPATNFRINIQCKAKLYIDDVSVVANDAPTVNLINNPGFEGTITEGYEVYAIKLLDEDKKEIAALGSGLDGQTVTGKVAVTNCDTENLTGQLLIAIYDGYELKKLIASEKIDLTENGTTVITKTFTMPNYKSTYRVKAFVWDSIENMRPLSGNILEF